MLISPMPLLPSPPALIPSTSPPPPLLPSLLCLPPILSTLLPGSLPSPLPAAFLPPPTSLAVPRRPRSWHASQRAARGAWICRSTGQATERGGWWIREGLGQAAKWKGRRRAARGAVAASWRHGQRAAVQTCCERCGAGAQWIFFDTDITIRSRTGGDGSSRHFRS